MKIDIKNLNKSILITLLTFLLIASVQFFITFIKIDRNKSYSVSFENFNFFINSEKVSTVLSINSAPFFLAMILMVYFYNYRKSNLKQ